MPEETALRKLILQTELSPGDICTLTAAIESLHAQCPGQFLTDVRTSCDALFEHNPRITRLNEDDAEVIEMHYTDLICRSDSTLNPFLRGYCDYLGKKLDIPLELTTNRPHLYLSGSEQSINPIANHTANGPARYWVLTAGIKRDFTLKQWPVEYYQKVVNHFRGKIQFVQIGSAEHDHPMLDGVINLVGETTTRELMQLVYHAQGGLGPITFLQHLCAAFDKPYMALLGGREPVAWTQYPLQTTFHTIGKLPCCRSKACWRSRVVRLNDGSEEDESICDSPVLDMQRPVGKCMSLIRPIDVIRAIETCFDGVAMSYLADSTPAKTIEVEDRQNESTSSLDLLAYSAWGFNVRIVPATTHRDWMDQAKNGFAYHCLPMTIANQSGWFVLAPHGAIVEWNGGEAPEDLMVSIPGASCAAQAVSQVGSGILTWTIPYVFRTPPGWNLLCRGPANWVKDGVAPLEGLVEADWSVASFSMNWKLTRPGRVEFKDGEPVAMLVPHKREDLESFRPRFANLRDNLELEDGYTRWIASRQAFWQAQRRKDPDATGQRFQKHYLKGTTVNGQFFADHQKSRRLATFAPVNAPGKARRAG